jgi:hypothetical protein
MIFANLSVVKEKKRKKKRKRERERERERERRIHPLTLEIRVTR